MKVCFCVLCAHFTCKKRKRSVFSLSDMLRTRDSSQCKFGENCTFAYNQLEIDVWTMERNRQLDRTLLFDTAGAKRDPVNIIISLLQDYQGVFVFLCQVRGVIYSVIAHFLLFPCRFIL